MNYRHYFLALLCFLGAFTEGHTQQPCGLTVTGRVLHNKSEEVLAFASVRVQATDQRVQTDEAGDFVLNHLCAGRTYVLEIRLVGYGVQQRRITATQGGFYELRLQQNATLEEVVILEKAVAPPVHPIELKVNEQDYHAGMGTGWSELLKRQPGIQLLGSGPTVMKPVIQGLHSGRVALVNNNVVHESQSWGEDHAPEIDPATAGHMHIVKGATGVRYGPGAMGGALILDPLPLRHLRGVGGWAALSGAANGGRYSIAGSFDLGLPRLGVGTRLSFSRRRSGNMSTPDYYMENTGSSDYNFAWLTGWRGGNWSQELALSTVQQINGMLRAAYPGNLTDLLTALKSPTPINNKNAFTYESGRPRQQTAHHQGKYRLTWLPGRSWKISAQHAFQFNDRLEFAEDGSLTDPDDVQQKPQLAMRLISNASDFSAEHTPEGPLRGGGGVQFFHQQNTISEGSFIPDYTTVGGAVWITEGWHPTNARFALEAGWRYDVRRTTIRYEGDFRTIHRNIQFHNTSGLLGMDYRIGRECLVNLQSGYAWRPPNVVELYARGIQVSAAAYKEGDSTLRVERALNTNITFQGQHTLADWSVNVYRNYLWDFIYLQPRQKVVTSVQGAFLAYDYTQNDAFIQGVDVSLDLHLAKRVSVGNRISVLQGMRTERQRALPGRQPDWLPLMPPVRWIYDIKWYWGRPSDKRSVAQGWGSKTRVLLPRRVYERDSYVRFSTEVVLRQKNIPPEGLLKPAPSSYYLLNVDVARSFAIGHTRIYAGLSVVNALNQRYRNYLNFFRFFSDEPGRNIIFWMHVSF
jgi:iron complex outermembrane receptor protein